MKCGILVRTFGVLLLVSTCTSSPFKRLKDVLKDTRKPIQLEDVVENKFDVSSFNGTWISDNEFAYMAESGDLYQFDAVTGIKKKIVPSFMMFMEGLFEFAPNRKKILFKHDIRSIFRHSFVARYDIYDIESSKSEQVANGELLQHCTWSPTSDAVVYVLKNDVYLRNSSGEETRLTKDGIPGIVYNGVTDWVYEEEVFNSGDAIWFSPDGRKLAFAHFNDTKVIGFPILLYGDSEEDFFQYPQEILIKYPKPGTPNPHVELRVIDLEHPDKGWSELPAPVPIVTSDNILQSVAWSGQDTVMSLWYNRRQNLGTLQKCNYTGLCEEVIRLGEPKGWLAAGELLCTPKGKNCLLRNWIGNWMQIWNLDLSNNTNIWKPLGNVSVTNIYGYKDSTGDVFYSAAPRERAMEMHVYKNKECLSCNVTFDDGMPCTFASAEFSANFSYYALSCKGPNLGYIKILNSDTNKEVTTWEKNTAIRTELQKYLQPQVKYLRVDVEGGYKALVKLLLPPELDFNDPKPRKKYPMIVSVYGGPGSVKVADKYNIEWEAYLVTSRKVIYATIDGRGSAYKGKDMMYEINNRMGTVEVEDQISVTKFLQKNLSFVDVERTGLWGWSYGGYVTAMAIAKDTDRVFQCGISVAPVTSWMFYDSIYTERYMGLPTVSDNLLKYISSDVSRQVKNFKNHDYLLVHGSGDDNVHFQQSMILSRALQQEDIPFEQMFYADEVHSLGSVRRHLYHTMDQFWTNCLNLDNEEE